MTSRPPAGQIVILNGAPRSGKSSIVAAVQGRLAGALGEWMNLGVDVHQSMLPAALRPGIGRPGGERPDLEPFVVAAYAALYDAVAAHSRQGLNVVVDVGHHDAYSEPLGILPDCARRLSGLPVLFVGVRCLLDVIVERRREAHPGREGQYLSAASGEAVPPPVLAWQREVHLPGLYDLEVDTSVLSPEGCADLIGQALRKAPEGPSAFERLAGGEVGGESHMDVLAIDHVQLAMPAGEEDRARAFYRDVLGLPEQPKPDTLARRGGVWFGQGDVRLHLGVEEDFRPARKAHPAFRVRGLERFRARCAEAGHPVVVDEPLPGYRRFYVSDPFGNRLEFLEPLDEAE